MSELILPITFSAFWLHAHGEGGGADFDLVMERDREGFPVLRARHVAGLLRVALLRAEAWEWFPAASTGIASILLGDLGDNGPGCLSVSDARLSDGLQEALGPDRTWALFQRIPSTAIDPKTGAAKPKHLRAVEAALPVPLRARIQFEPGRRRIWAGGRPDEHAVLAKAEQHWRSWIACAWPAFDEAGAKRTRGFGRIAWRELSGEATGA